VEQTAGSTGKGHYKPPFKFGMGGVPLGNVLLLQRVRTGITELLAKINVEKIYMTFKHCTVAGATILAGASLMVVIAANDAKTVASGNREMLLQTAQSWNGKPYTHYPTGQPQLTTIKLTIAPHTALPWHTHPFPNVVYVLSGTLTLQDKASGKTQVVHQEEAVGESVDDIHRGESGDEPTVLLITYAGTPGVPTSIPAKGERAEY
jgi:quercetin dioxygenase-like cupin family protein